MILETARPCLIIHNTKVICCILQQHFHVKIRYISPWHQTTTYNFVGRRGTTACQCHCIIARKYVVSEFIEMRGTAASNCVEMRGFLVRGIARICNSQNAWKCAEPRLAWECELRVCPRTAARVRGTRVGSAREVRLICGSSARSRGSAHWWVPYLYGTGTLRVKQYEFDSWNTVGVDQWLSARLQ